MYACCPECEKLCPARQGPQKWGTRERVYYVEPHNRPACERCRTSVRFVLDADDHSGRYYCESSHALTEDEIIAGPACNGHTKAIK